MLINLHISFPARSTLPAPRRQHAHPGNLARSLLALLVALTLLAAAPPALPAEAASSGPEKSDRPVYQFDLAKILFASPVVEAAERPALLAMSDELEALAALPATADRLTAGFALLHRMRLQFRRHDLYLFLRYATDTRREEALGEAAQLRARVRSAAASFSAAATGLSSEQFAAAMRTEPRLARHRFAFESMQRNAAHALEPAAARVANLFEGIVTGQDYNRIVASMVFETVSDGEDNPLDPRIDGNAIYASLDPAVREEGSRKLYQGYASQKDSLALLLTTIVRRENAAAQARGFAQAREAVTSERYLAPAAPEALLATIADHAEFHKRWQAAHPRALTTRRQWTLDQLRQDLTASAALLGAVYGQETAALLDPAAGRVDLASGPNRLPITGTASVYPIGTSIIYGGEFSGSLYDLIVIAHEAGHAVQAQLMFRSGVPMTYSAGPGFFTESFGRFQELLLLRHLAKNEPDASIRSELESALEARLLAVFASAEEAAIELRIHREISSGPAPSADQLDGWTAEEGSRFSNGYRESPERKGLWQLAESYYQAPLHKVDDLYSSLLAVRYFAAYESDPAAFAPKYLSLLRSGYDAAPAELLRSRVGIDLEKPEFALETLRWLEQRIAKD